MITKNHCFAETVVEGAMADGSWVPVGPPVKGENYRIVHFCEEHHTEGRCPNCHMTKEEIDALHDDNLPNVTVG